MEGSNNGGPFVRLAVVVEVSLTYFGWAAFNLGHFSAAATVGLFLVKLQILQPLSQRQFLLDGHAEEGVECLFLILRCC